MDTRCSTAVLMLSVCAGLILAFSVTSLADLHDLPAGMAVSSDLDDIKGSLEDGLLNSTGSQDDMDEIALSDQMSQSGADIRILYPITVIIIVTYVVLMVGMNLHRHRSSRGQDEEDDADFYPPPPEPD